MERSPGLFLRNTLSLIILRAVEIFMVGEDKIKTKSDLFHELIFERVDLKVVDDSLLGHSNSEGPFCGVSDSFGSERSGFLIID